MFKKENRYMTKSIVEIIHKQEASEYECSLCICNENIVDKVKIYAIDSIEYSTLMFSYEY